MSRNREIYFNELSQYPYARDEKDATDILQAFFELLNELYCYEGLDVGRFRIGNEEYQQWKISPSQTIQEFINRPQCQKFKEFFYSHFDCPIIDSRSDISIFINRDKPVLVWGEKKLLCKGLAAAHYGDTLAVSLNTDSFWRSVVFKLNVDSKEVLVVALAEKADIYSKAFKDWFAKVKPTEIPFSQTPPEKKKLTLSGDHHGKVELNQLWKKLKNKVYIEECICSLPFDSYSEDPVLKVYDNGIIDVANIKSDKGCAMKIRTTARNIYETQRVASLIREWLK